MFLKKTLAMSILTVPALMLSGCGGDGTTTQNTTSSVPFTLALTDGPVDSAMAVVIELTGVAIKPKEGETIEVEFETPRSIDLLQLQDGVVTDLISDLELAPGDYHGVYLHINAVKDDVMDSYVELEDGTTVELQLQGNADHGLHITKQFTLTEGEPADFTIDFDLRKSLNQREGYIELKPHLHLVHNHRAGHVHGDLDSALVADMCADPSVELGAVYVYSGADATPTDVNGSEADPVASALVKLAPHGEYRYHVGFLEAGEYTVAYTCDAASDNPEEVNELNFAVLEPITIEARTEHEHPFPPTAPHEMWDESVCDRILDSESADEETPTPIEGESEGEEESVETPVRPIPPHLQHWCETGEKDWHPRPGRGDDADGEPVDPPVPPTNDEDADNEGDVTEEEAGDETADPVV